MFYVYIIIIIINTLQTEYTLPGQWDLETGVCAHSRWKWFDQRFSVWKFNAYGANTETCFPQDVFLRTPKILFIYLWAKLIHYSWHSHAVCALYIRINYANLHLLTCTYHSQFILIEIVDVSYRIAAHPSILFVIVLFAGIV